MTPLTKTLSDCSRCPVLRYCDLHVSNGGWKHDKGVEPCKVVVE